jgi:CheY-like chemotaxis protein
MPRAGGREAAEAIRVLRPQLPILFATGYAREGVPLPADATQDPDVLQKPFSSQELLERVRRALDGRRAPD